MSTGAEAFIGSKGRDTGGGIGHVSGHCRGSKAGSYSRRIDLCITQRWAREQYGRQRIRRLLPVVHPASDPTVFTLVEARSTAVPHLQENAPP